VAPGNLTIEELFLQMDDRKYRTRERATQSLLQMGESVVPKLRVKLKGPLSLEVRRRIERLLLQLNDPSETPEQMRAVRAINALGRIGLPASRALLAELAEGPDEAPKTIAAGAHSSASALRRKSPRSNGMGRKPVVGRSRSRARSVQRKGTPCSTVPCYPLLPWL